MAMPETITKIKSCLRISHNALNGEIEDCVEGAIADLQNHGISITDETDPLVLAAIKLYCKSNLTEDVNLADKYQDRYAKQREFLMMAGDYPYEYI